MTDQVGMSRSPSEYGRFRLMEQREHIRQSIIDILTTPLGTRVMLPDYGSKLPRLVDRPITPTWKLSVYAAVAEALGRWEPRVKVERMRVTIVTAGGMDVEIDYQIVTAGVTETLSIRVGSNQEAKA